MKKSWRAVVAILGLGCALGGGVIPLCHAQEQNAVVQESPANMSLRVQALEKEVGELRSELASLKQSGKGDTSAPAPATAAAPQENAAITTQPATKSASGPSIASLLGPTALSGFVDMYYDYNSNQPASRTNSFRSFDGASNQFALNLVELVVDKTPEITNSRTGYHVALGFGQAMNAVNGTDPGGLGFAQYLKEAYFSYLAPVGKGLQIDAGKFVTPHGAEVIETKDDLNYSRGLLFSYAIPYYHYGLRAKYAFSDKYSVSGFLVNGWNNVVDNNTGKTYGLGFGWNPTKKISFTQNFMAGPEQSNNNSNWRQLWDTVITYSPTSRLSFTLNTDYGRGDRMKGVVDPVFWTGAAGYVKYAFNEKYAVVTRYEYYDDANGFTTGTAQHFNGFTATFQRLTAGHILSRLEFRRDVSNEPTFTKGNGLPAGTQNTLTAGLVFMFDSREAK
jgi:Putative beta-barrel porin-2, OmpL-like. bbp2